MTRKKYNGPVLLILIIVSSSIIGIIVSNLLIKYLNDRPPIIRVFRSQWDTTKTSLGSSNDRQIHLPLVSDGKYNFMVEWGDGSSNTIMMWNQAEVMHTYSYPGNYTISITGLIIGWSFKNAGDKLKIKIIEEWGNLQLGNYGWYFLGCENLKITASDVLNLTGTTTLARAFQDCDSLDVVNRMNEWDTSCVTDMSDMFSGADTFNQPIGYWDTSRVTDMSFMFFGAVSFNQPIGYWNTSNVLNMDHMFSNAASFNQHIGYWTISNVTDMNNMFSGAEDFNQSIGMWDTSNVKTMKTMFYRAFSFNQPIGNWDTGKVTDMRWMFGESYSFNQPIGDWNTGNVTDMYHMFYNADKFDQDISNWNVSSVTNMIEMFYDVTLSTENYDNLLIEWSKLELRRDVIFDAGRSKFSLIVAENARQNIIDDYNWTINDWGDATP